MRGHHRGGGGGPAALPVVLDAMGGDDAPAQPLAAARELAAAGDAVVLCGPADLLAGTGLDVLPADRWVAADADVTAAVRDPGTSARVAVRAVAEGRAAAVVSAGPTGALVAAAVAELGRAPGARRPALAARIPADGGRDVWLVDAGALPEADGPVLAGHARLVHRHLLARGVAAPRVGLLNVASEPGRGPARVREAAALLAGEAWAAGFVEPADVVAGAVDAVVADGFAGNVLLKALEAVHARSGGLGAGDRDGAALLLGVRGTVLVAHGAARASELVHAVRAAAQLRPAAGPVDRPVPPPQGSR